MKLLYAEDEPAMAEAVTDILEYHNFTVDTVYDGAEALAYAREEHYDGIILDVMMPKMDGFSVLRELREAGDRTPVLLLTAKAEVEDRIAGLDLGADDYLPKPFDMGELLARVRAMLRRKADFSPANLTCGNLTLDRTGYELSTSRDNAIRLSGKEFQMMEMLMENPGRIISVDSFMDRIWAEGEADVNVVWVYISNLRKKLASLDARCEIKASRGVGYSINEIK